MSTLNHAHKKERIALFTVISLLFCFYVLTIRDGHIWGGDFALYIQHTMNLINGLPYTKTGHIVNPTISWASPHAYPPVVPFLLTPAAILFGMNLFAFKITLITILCLSLIVFHRLIINKLEKPGSRILLIILLGLSPWFWDYKDHILSEFPFIFFFISFLLIAEKYLKLDNLSKKHEITYGICIGLLAYLAYGCRSIGIILIPVFIAAYILYRRKIRLALIISSIIFLILYIIQNNILNTDAAYTKMVGSLDKGLPPEDDGQLFDRGSFLRYVTHNLTIYFFSMERYWANGYSLTIRVITVIVTSALFLLGFYNLVWKKNISEIMTTAYIGLLIVVPFNQGTRYLLPFLPFYLLYIVKGLEDLPRYKRAPKWLPALALALITFSYIGNTLNRDFSEHYDHVEGPPAKELYQFITNNLKSSDIVVSKKPRVLTLYTQVKSFNYFHERTSESLWKNFKQLNANYFLFMKNQIRHHPDNTKKLLNQHADDLTIVFENKQFILYKIKEPLNNK